MKKGLFIFLLVLLQSAAFSQEKNIILKGVVSEAGTGTPLPGISVLVKGTLQGTTSRETGAFQLTVNALPVTLVFSGIGYDMLEISITNAGQQITIQLTPQYKMGAEVVVAPTRINTRALESPVSIERIGKVQLQNNPSTSYYDLIGNLKGVDITTSSLTFKTMSTRGFNGSGSARVNQLMDGMDNQAPGLNFPVGGFLGLSSLDVESVELLPGASSALYGPGGMNGTILVNSKDPFRYQGLSFELKEGVMHTDHRQRSQAGLLSQWAFRWAAPIGKKSAFKLGGELLQAKDWLADNSLNYDRASGKLINGDRETDPNYDGVNVYGDETSLDLRLFMSAVLPAGHPLLNSPMPVSRTGYQEKDIIDPNTKNLKLSGAFHYKVSEKTEAILSGFWGTGNTVYTGSNRYALKDIRMGQYKLEFKNPRWMVRAYTTQENAGQSYSATVATQIFNEGWKPSYNPSNVAGSWYPQYTQAFLTGLNTGLSPLQAHIQARKFADQGRPEPGTPAFKALFDQVRSIPIPNGGLFTDRSDLWMAEAQYNLTDLLKFAEVVVGANQKKYVLNSNGTIFIDTAGKLNINETGAYLQISKKLFGDKLQLSASGRYDKNANFDGKFTPRFTALVQLAKNNNLRFSYQSAYRFPTTQQQYIKLKIGGGVTLLGGLPWIVDYMKNKSIPCYVLVNGIPDLSKPWEYKKLKPESVQSFEAGYKGLIATRLLIDAYAYWGTYTDFLGRMTLVQPTSPSTQNIYSIVTNSSTKVKTYGWGLGLDYRLRGNLMVNANLFMDKISDVPANFVAGFNAPELRYNLGISHAGFGKGKKIGCSLQYRWQKAFFYENDFAQGPVPAFGSLDAQVQYKLPKARSVVKLGGTNITNSYYLNAYGNPQTGAVYYLGFAYNIK